MKILRLALTGVLPAFVLLVAIQFSADAASTAQSPEMPSWFAGDDAINQHPWLPVSTFSNSTFLTQLTLANRVAYQRAIEGVYWRHRIWPRNRGERPALDAVMSQAAIEQKVQGYLRDSELIEEESQQPITPEQLQAEIDRMAQHSKQPEVLRELFAALHNDPLAIAECLARPALLGHLQFAKAEGREEPFESSSARAPDQMPDITAAANTNYTVPAISSQPNDCTDDTWTPTKRTGAPMRRSGHTAVWTGSEMIVWGGGLDLGAIYTPSTDSWRNTSTINAPSARGGNTAVWTGTEMIVWGGGGYTDTGGRYNPVTDSWIATSTTGAPTPRGGHTAVWTGNEMIVWGGFGPINDTFKYLKTGGRYDPVTDSWTATSTTNAPDIRGGHTAVWTGSEMIIWGGSKSIFNSYNTGGRYNPVTNSWTATSTTNVPIGRDSHTAVWTGSEMIVWGGFNWQTGEPMDTGSRYSPSTDSWAPTSTTNTPSARISHTAVWTDSEMIVWGGNVAYRSGYFNSGGRYDPATDSWTATSTLKAPAPRAYHTAVWTGGEMIVWGGEIETFEVVNTGGRYCAQARSPTIALDANKRSMEEINTVRLKWSGATSTDIDVYRDETLIVTTSNDGSYVDSTGDTGRARYTYQVCEADTQVCSNEETVIFNQ